MKLKNLSLYNDCIKKLKSISIKKSSSVNNSIYSYSNRIFISYYFFVALLSLFERAPSWTFDYNCVVRSTFSWRTQSERPEFYFYSPYSVVSLGKTLQAYDIFFIMVIIRLVHGTYFSVPSYPTAIYAYPIPSHPMGFPLEYNSIKIIKFMKI